MTSQLTLKYIPISLVCLVLAVLLLSLFQQVMGWIALLAICAIGVRLSVIFGRQSSGPSMRTINLLAVFCAIVLAYFSSQLGLLLAMVNLLLMACALKLMAVRQNKDFLQLILSLMFLIGCGFIFQQSIGFTLVYLLLTLLLLSALAYHFSPGLPPLLQSKQLGKLCLQALPIGLLFFLVLPKLGPLWQMPTNSSGSTGISETMSPGDFAELSQSSELAFRATFAEAIPAQQQRYWRAMVLEAFDGTRWTIHPRRRALQKLAQQNRQEFKPQLLGNAVNYQLLVEPSQQHWLFSLDVSVPADSKAHGAIWQDSSYQLISHRPILSQMQYQLQSYPETLLKQTTGQFDHHINLQLPDQGNPNTQAWVADLRQQYPDNGRFIATVLDYFRQQGFVYTLTPALMPTDTVDRFLFDYQAGFCAHYASALAYALRLAGIPARVVVGYQGGEEHASGYVSVHQYDAHAWVEAWQTELGWQRIDPTAVVSPTRIHHGLQAAMQAEGSFLQDAPFALTKLRNIALVNQLRLWLADMDYFWSRWVLGFDQQSQYDLIKAIVGQMSQQRLTLFGIGFILIIAALLVLFFLPSLHAKKRDPLMRIYLDAEHLLTKLNIQRAHWQSIGDFCEQVQSHTPTEVGQTFSSICAQVQQQIYAAADHSPKHQKARLTELTRLTKRLKILVATADRLNDKRRLP